MEECEKGRFEERMRNLVLDNLGIKYQHGDVEWIVGLKIRGEVWLEIKIWESSVGKWVLRL